MHKPTKLGFRIQTGAALGILALALPFAVGCARSTETRYYQLDMTPSGGVQTETPIQIERLTVADDLARPDIMVQKDATELEYYADARWAVNVPELVRRKLEAEFGSGTSATPEFLVDGEILAFQQVDVPGGAEARVALRLRFRKGPEAVSQNAYTRQVPAEAPTPKALAQALSRALEQIAAEIAADAARLARD